MTMLLSRKSHRAGRNVLLTLFLLTICIVGMSAENPRRRLGGAFGKLCGEKVGDDNPPRTPGSPRARPRTPGASPARATERKRKKVQSMTKTLSKSGGKDEEKTSSSKQRKGRKQTVDAKKMIENKAKSDKNSKSTSDKTKAKKKRTITASELERQRKLLKKTHKRKASADGTPSTKTRTRSESVSSNKASRRKPESPTGKKNKGISRVQTKARQKLDKKWQNSAFNTAYERWIKHKPWHLDSTYRPKKPRDKRMVHFLNEFWRSPGITGNDRDWLDYQTWWREYRSIFHDKLAADAEGTWAENNPNHYASKDASKE